MALDETSIDNAFAAGSGGVVPAEAFSTIAQLLGAVALLYVGWVGYKVIKTIVEDPRNAPQHFHPLIRAIVLLVVILMIAKP